MNTRTEYNPDTMAPGFAKERYGHPLPIRLTVEQRQTIKEEAKRLDCSEVDVVRRALEHYFALPKGKRRRSP